MNLKFWQKSEPASEQRSISVHDVYGEYNAGSILDFAAFGPDRVSVNIPKALGVPSVWASVDFLSNAVAGLPFCLYERSEDGREKLYSDPLYKLLHDSPNPEMTSYDFRKYIMWQALTTGRCASYIERARNNRVVGIWPLDPSRTEVRKQGMRKTYVFTEDRGQQTVYDSSEIIDITFAVEQDQFTAISPIMRNRGAVGLAIALQDYAQKLFLNGGIPPLSLQGPFPDGKSIDNASADVQRAIQKAANEGRQVLPMPLGHELKGLAFNPEQGQLVEARLYALQEIARIYGLPPQFLQDYSKGNFANAEQEDIRLVKYTLNNWVERIEQEFNLKLFRSAGQRFVELDLNGLLRGDLKARSDAYAKYIQNGILTPNEVRRRENMPDMEGADDLMIQQNMVGVSQLSEVVSSKLNKGTSNGNGNTQPSE